MKLKALACAALLCAGFGAQAATTLIDANQLYLNPPPFTFTDDLTAFNISGTPATVSGYLDFSDYVYDDGASLLVLADSSLTGLTVNLYNVGTSTVVATRSTGAFSDVFNFNFGTVAAGTYEIRFTGTNNRGSYLDAASYTVTAVPEPQSLAMMLAGLGAVGFMARRRRVK